MVVRLIPLARENRPLGPRGRLALDRVGDLSSRTTAAMLDVTDKTGGATKTLGKNGPGRTRLVTPSGEPLMRGGLHARRYDTVY